VYGEAGTAFTLPSRPDWSYDLGKEELEQREEEYFKGWLERTYSLCPADELSFFEHNLEVWRQLWRVCEISDIVVIVVDARHPLLNFPPSLYEYIVKGLGKRMCVALTKTDIVGPKAIEAWRAYFHSRFPAIAIVSTSIYDVREIGKEGRLKRYTDALGVGELVALMQSMSEQRFGGEWSQFRQKRLQEKSPEGSAMASLEEGDYVTVGMVGQPNAGKSSLINSIVGRKCVSASRTPGHTKHFQTVHLTKHIRLCDCPGLIFPMRVPKWLQILAGIYNVAQVKDPYAPLMHLAQHLDLPRALGLHSQPPRGIWHLCEDFAIQRGFFTAKAARPDVYRAGIILWSCQADY